LPWEGEKGVFPSQRERKGRPVIVEKNAHILWLKGGKSLGRKKKKTKEWISFELIPKKKKGHDWTCCLYHRRGKNEKNRRLIIITGGGGKEKKAPEQFPSGKEKKKKRKGHPGRNQKLRPEEGVPLAMPEKKKRIIYVCLGEKRDRARESSGGENRNGRGGGGERGRKRKLASLLKKKPENKEKKKGSPLPRGKKRGGRGRHGFLLEEKKEMEMERARKGPRERKKKKTKGSHAVNQGEKKADPVLHLPDAGEGKGAGRRGEAPLLLRGGKLRVATRGTRIRFS